LYFLKGVLKIVGDVYQDFEYKLNLFNKNKKKGFSFLSHKKNPAWLQTGFNKNE